MKNEKSKERAIFKAFMKITGIEEQNLKAIEEFSELIRAITKYMTSKSNDNYEHLLKEIVDAELMIGQIKYIVNQEPYLKILKEKKMLELTKFIEDVQADIQS